jgi:hypothetical protein
LAALILSGLRLLVPPLFGGVLFGHGAFPWFGDIMPLNPTAVLAARYRWLIVCNEAAAAD